MNAYAQRWIFMAILYFVAGVGLGIGMGIAGDHRLMGVHAHVNLLGWVSMALIAIIYHFFPRAGQNKLAGAHFWMYQLALPCMLVGLAAKLLGNPALEPVLGIGSLLVGISVVLFAINVMTRRA